MPEFRPANPDDRLLYELMPILIGIGPDEDLLYYGSCFIAWPHMAITARHVIDELLRHDPGIMSGAPCRYEYWVTQVKWEGNDHDYVVWTIDSIATSPPFDIAIIWLKGLNDTAARYKEWKAAPVTFDPPPIGSTVRAFGIHNVRFDGSRVNVDARFVPGGVETARYRLQDLSAQGIFTPTGWDRVLIHDALDPGGPITIRYLRKQ
jgi:hypothetical protein